LSVPGYGHIMSSIGKSQVVFDSELLTQPIVSHLFCVPSGTNAHDLARSFVDGWIWGESSAPVSHLFILSITTCPFFRILQTAVLALCLMTISMTVAFLWIQLANVSCRIRFSQCNSRRLCLRM
jgi:hypothetical protein